MTDKEAIDYVKEVIKNSEKVILAGQPVNEVRLYTTDKGLEMLRHVVELAEQVSCPDLREETSKDMGRYDPYTDSFVNDDCLKRDEVSKWTYERDIKTEWWTHVCGEAINDETMRLLWLDGAKYCPFCGKPCIYDYTERESENRA